MRGRQDSFRYHQLTPGPVAIQLHSRPEARALSVGSHSLWRVCPEYGSGGANMEPTASGREALAGPVFEGWNIGAVSVPRARGSR